MAESLVLFSGGKDSFLTACYEIEAGNIVRLISFNNSAVLGEKNLLHGATRLMNRYGKHTVSYIGCYNTGAVINSLSKSYAYLCWEELGTKYPNLMNAQVTCLHCQTAMWACAIAYASVHKIPVIASGYRKSDLFCTGLSEYINRITCMAKQFGCQVKLPAWDDDKWVNSPDCIERDMEMADRGFSTAVLEPKCMLGRPVKPMKTETMHDMVSYFDDILAPVLRSEIKHMQPILRVLPLSPESMTGIEYPVPDGSQGFY